MVWAASQTEKRPLPLILLGDCWPPVMQAIREHLVVSDKDLDLLRFATRPEDAMQEVHTGLREKRIGHGPYG